MANYAKLWRSGRRRRPVYLSSTKTASYGRKGLFFPERRTRGTCLKFAVKIFIRGSSVVQHDHAFSFPTQLIMHNCFYHAACFTHAHGETPLASNSLKASNSIAPGSMEPILNTCSTAAETFKQTANWLSWTRRRVWAWNRYDIVTSFPARVPVHVSYV